MRRFLAALLLTCILASPLARADDAAPALSHSVAPPAFTPAQRAEIIAIVRDAMKTDPTILRDAVEALQADEANVKDVAARIAIDHAQPALTQESGDPVAGNPNGDVTVVEFYDLRCPYCRKMLPVIAQMLQHDKKLRLIYKDIPILGADSVLGARAVLAAQRQDGYQKMHDLIMSGPQMINDDTLRAAAGKAGLDWDRLQRDMADPAIMARINANLDLAHTLGIDGTPVYVVGKHMLPGAVDLAELQNAVAAARQP